MKNFLFAENRLIGFAGEQPAAAPEPSKEVSDGKAQSELLEQKTVQLEKKIGQIQSQAGTLNPENVKTWEQFVNGKIDEINGQVMEDQVKAIATIEATLKALDIVLEYQESHTITVERNGRDVSLTVPMIRGKVPATICFEQGSGCVNCVQKSEKGWQWTIRNASRDLKMVVKFYDGTKIPVDMSRSGEFNIAASFNTKKIKRPEKKQPEVQAEKPAPAPEPAPAPAPEPTKEPAPTEVPRTEQAPETAPDNRMEVAQDLFRTLQSQIESGHVESARGEIMDKFNDAVRALPEMDRVKLFEETGLQDGLVIENNEEGAGQKFRLSVTPTETVVMEDVVEASLKKTPEAAPDNRMEVAQDLFRTLQSQIESGYVESAKGEILEKFNTALRALPEMDRVKLFEETGLQDGLVIENNEENAGQKFRLSVTPTETVVMEDVVEAAPAEQTSPEEAPKKGKKKKEKKVKPSRKKKAEAPSAETSQEPEQKEAVKQPELKSALDDLESHLSAGHGIGFEVEGALARLNGILRSKNPTQRVEALVAVGLMSQELNPDSGRTEQRFTPKMVKDGNNNVTYRIYTDIDSKVIRVEMEEPVEAPAKKKAEAPKGPQSTAEQREAAYLKNALDQLEFHLSAGHGIGTEVEGSLRTINDALRSKNPTQRVGALVAVGLMTQELNPDTGLTENRFTPKMVKDDNNKVTYRIYTDIDSRVVGVETEEPVEAPAKKKETKETAPATEEAVEEDPIGDIKSDIAELRTSIEQMGEMDNDTQAILSRLNNMLYARMDAYKGDTTDVTNAIAETLKDAKYGSILSGDGAKYAIQYEGTTFKIVQVEAAPATEEAVEEDPKGDLTAAVKDIRQQIYSGKETDDASVVASITEANEAIKQIPDESVLDSTLKDIGAIPGVEVTNSYSQKNFSIEFDTATQTIVVKETEKKAETTEESAENDGDLLKKAGDAFYKRVEALDTDGAAVAARVTEEVNALISQMSEEGKATAVDTLMGNRPTITYVNGDKYNVRFSKGADGLLVMEDLLESDKKLSPEIRKGFIDAVEALRSGEDVRAASDILDATTNAALSKMTPEGRARVLDTVFGKVGMEFVEGKFHVKFMHDRAKVTIQDLSETKSETQPQDAPEAVPDLSLEQAKSRFTMIKGMLDEQRTQLDGSVPQTQLDEYRQNVQDAIANRRAYMKERADTPGVDKAKDALMTELRAQITELQNDYLQPYAEMKGTEEAPQKPYDEAPNSPTPNADPIFTRLETPETQNSASENKETNETPEQRYNRVKAEQLVARDKAKYAEATTEWSSLTLGKMDFDKKNPNPYLYKQGTLEGKPVLLAYSPVGGLQVMDAETGVWRFMRDLNQTERAELLPVEADIAKKHGEITAAEAKADEYEARKARNAQNHRMEEECLKDPSADPEWFNRTKAQEEMWKENQKVKQALEDALKSGATEDTPIDPPIAPETPPSEPVAPPAPEPRPTPTPDVPPAPAPEPTPAPEPAPKTPEPAPAPKENKELQDENAELKRQIAELFKKIDELLARIKALEDEKKKPAANPEPAPSTPTPAPEQPKTTPEKKEILAEEIAKLKAERAQIDVDWKTTISQGYDALHKDNDAGFKKLDQMEARAKELDTLIAQKEAELKALNETNEVVSEDIDALLKERSEKNTELTGLGIGDSAKRAELKASIEAIDAKLKAIRTTLNEQLSKLPVGSTAERDAIKTKISRIDEVVPPVAGEKAPETLNANEKIAKLPPLERAKFEAASDQEWGTIGAVGAIDTKGVPYLYRKASVEVNGVKEPRLFAYGSNGYNMLDLDSGEWETMTATDPLIAQASLQDAPAKYAALPNKATEIPADERAKFNAASTEWATIGEAGVLDSKDAPYIYRKADVATAGGQKETRLFAYSANDGYAVMGNDGTWENLESDDTLLAQAGVNDAEKVKIS